MSPEELFEAGVQAYVESLHPNSGKIIRDKYLEKKHAALQKYDMGLFEFAAKQLGCVCGFADWITFPDDSVRCSHCEKEKA